MNSFLDEPDEPDDTWTDFVTVLAADPSVPEKARPHLARWVSQWRREGGDESAMITELIDRLRRAIRQQNLAVATEKTYVAWIARFSRFRLRRWREPDLDHFSPASATAYLEYLALERRVSPATQRQALNALVYLAKSVYGTEEVHLGFTPARGGSRRPPTVLTREEVRSLLNEMEDPWKLMCEVIYGAGLRQMEALRLRVKEGVNESNGRCCGILGNSATNISLP